MGTFIYSAPAAWNTCIYPIISIRLSIVFEVETKNISSPTINYSSKFCLYCAIQCTIFQYRRNACCYYSLTSRVTCYNTFTTNGCDSSIAAAPLYCTRRRHIIGKVVSPRYVYCTSNRNYFRRISKLKCTRTLFTACNTELNLILYSWQSS